MKATLLNLGKSAALPLVRVMLGGLTGPDDATISQAAEELAEALVEGGKSLPLHTRLKRLAHRWSYAGKLWISIAAWTFGSMLNL